MEIQSKYYNFDDLACHCCGALTIDPLLVQMLDSLSDAAGFKLEINCAYRCESHNAEVGGVEHSQHVLGKAADIAVPDGWTVDKLGDLITGLRVDGLGFDGIGRYYDSDFVHADIRSGGQEPGVYLWNDQE